MVFVAGQTRIYSAKQLATYGILRAEVAAVQEEVAALVNEAKRLREAAIENKLRERMLHSLTRSRRIGWKRR